MFCSNLVERNIVPGTSTLLSFLGRTQVVGTCVCMAWPWVAETMWKSRFAFLKGLAVFWVWALIDINSSPPTHEGKSQRVIRGPKWVWFRVLLGCGPPNWQVLSSALISRADAKDSNAAELVQHEPFVCCHVPYLTTQRTKLSDVWCFEILIIN